MTETLSLAPRFGRKAILTVVEEGRALKTIYGYDDSNATPHGLRMSFQVGRKISSIADTMQVRIWNLHPRTRGMLTQRSLQWGRGGDALRYVRLEAGHTGNVGVIFNGSIMRAWNTRQGPDWITEIEANMVFGHALLNQVDKSWGQGGPTPVTKLLKELFKVVGYKSIKFSPEATRELAGKAEAVFVVRGSAYESATDLLKSHKLTFNMDVDGVTIYSRGHPAKESSITLDERTGLLGSPKITNMGADFRTLLDSKIKPGQLLKVDSVVLRETVSDPSLGRDFPAMEVSCSGDTHGDDWHCDVSTWFYPPLSQVATSVPAPLLTGK